MPRPLARAIAPVLLSLVQVAETEAEVGSTAAGDVLINEVVTDPQQDWSDSVGGNGVRFDPVPGVGAPSSDDEWVELFNASETTLDLTSWTLVMTDGSPESGTLGSDFSEVRTSDPGCTLASATPGCYLVLGDPVGTLSNAVFLVLRDPLDAVIDDVELGDDPEGDGNGDGAPDGGVDGGNATGAGDEAVYRVLSRLDTDIDVDDFDQAAATPTLSNCTAADGETATLQDDTLLATLVVEVCDTLTVGPNYEVAGPNGDLTLRAGVAAVLENGTSVTTDGVLAVELGPPL